MNGIVTRPDLSLLERDLVLPAEPGAVLEVIRLGQEERPDLAALVHGLGRDPVLAGRLLRLANSPDFGRPGTVATLSGAVRLLGPRGVVMAAVSFSLVAPVQRRTSGGREIDRIWRRRAVVTATCARELAARSLGRVDPEEAYACGLLMDIGFPAILDAAPALYGPALATADAGHPDPEKERRCLGTTHAEVGAHLLRSWGLPGRCIGAVLVHHDPSARPEGANPDLSYILAVSHDLARAVFSTAGRPAALADAQAKAKEWFDIPVTAIPTIAERIGRQETEATLGPAGTFGGHGDLDVLLNQAQGDLAAMACGMPAEPPVARENPHGIPGRPPFEPRTGPRSQAACEDLITQYCEFFLLQGLDIPIAVMMVAIDDLDGLRSGDRPKVVEPLLEAVGEALERNCRTGDRCSDTVCRQGAETFAVILADVAFEDLGSIAERFRRAVEGLDVGLIASGIEVTASVGGCLLRSLRTAAKPGDILAEARRNLVVATKLGRSRCFVSVYPDL